MVFSKLDRVVKTFFYELIVKRHPLNSSYHKRLQALVAQKKLWISFYLQLVMDHSTETGGYGFWASLKTGYIACEGLTKGEFLLHSIDLAFWTSQKANISSIKVLLALVMCTLLRGYLRGK